MRTVEFKLDENEFKNITNEAKHLGVPRSELIRSRVVNTPRQVPGAPTLSGYMDIVNSVRQRMGNAIAPSQVEQCVAITLRCLHG